jgi:DNA mismatch repair protein MutS
MRQYLQFKKQYPDYVLFFRMGDFYEMFWDDAKLASRVLGVALTSRSKGGLDAAESIPMAGVPFHAVDGYLRRMIAAGHRVAICEQVEDASQAKGLIQREVTRLMTPGTLTDDPLLDGRSDNYLCAVAFGIVKGAGYRVGLTWIELSTGAVTAMTGDEQQALDEIARLRPAEILIPELPGGQPHDIAKKITALGDFAQSIRPGWQFTPHHALDEIRSQWQARSTAGFGFTDDDPAICAIGAALSYLQETQKTSLAHLAPPSKHVADDYLLIDPSSYRSLEIDRTVRTGSTEGSLLSVIDQTHTTMGSRLLRRWLRYPLCDIEHISTRQDTVETLLSSPETLDRAASLLAGTCDIERIVARLTVLRAGPRDLKALAETLARLPALIDEIDRLGGATAVTGDLAQYRSFCDEQGAYLLSAILDQPAVHLREGGVIADGFDAELDRLRLVSTNSKSWLVDYQKRLIEETSISTLKVGYNRVFGYYIEVTDAHRQRVPASWIRKQTLKGAERYITPELKEFETEALSARDRSIALEQRLFEQVRQSLVPHIQTFQDMARSIAQLDVLCSFAQVARDRKYCRPKIVEQRVLHIEDGKHPVLEAQLRNEFVANDVRFNESDSLQLITGPNMAGKSTFIRQVALINVLAHVGSYVPAKSATIGVTDRIFTRIGASDELHTGQSTFMVEMTETANILNNATDRSLVILDEIGRGTSTLDGLSLAWAIAEHIASELHCRTLFATHYHELTDLAQRFDGVKNFNVAVREWEDQVIFLHRIVEGGTDRSYGIHVARLAGVPRSVLERARKLLGELAVHHVGRPQLSTRKRSADATQMEMFIDPSRQLLSELVGLDLESLSPLETFELLRKWKQKYGKP